MNERTIILIVKVFFGLANMSLRTLIKKYKIESLILKKVIFKLIKNWMYGFKTYFLY
jgi:hypothetical protein